MISENGQQDSDFEVKQNVEKKIVEHIIKFEKKDETFSEQEKNEALMTFEAEKKNLKDLSESLGHPLSESDLNEISSGYDLTEKFRELLEDVKDEKKPSGTPSKPPQGKVRLNQDLSSQGESYGSTQEMIDDVYDNLEKQIVLQRIGSKDFNQEQLKFYQDRANKLLTSLIQGERNREKITSFKIWQCTRCQKSVLGSSRCPDCGSLNQEYGEKTIPIKVYER